MIVAVMADSGRSQGRCGTRCRQAAQAERTTADYLARMWALILRHGTLGARTVALAAAACLLWACEATAQGGVDAQSRKARADSIRRAQRIAGKGTPAAVAPAPVAPVAPKGAPARAALKQSPAARTRASAPRAKAAVTPPPPAIVPSTPVVAAPVPKSVAPAVAPAAAPATPVASTPAPVVTAPAVNQAPSSPVVVPPPPAAAPQRRFSARETDSLRSRWTVEEPVVWVASPLSRRVSPGLGFATPSGYGPAWGDFFMSVSYQARTRFTQRQDGALGVGMGLGDPVGGLGGELVYSSFGTSRSGLFSNGTLSARAHRIIRGYGISAGLENVVAIGRQTSAGPDGGRSFFVAVSQMRRLFDSDSVAQVESSGTQELMWTLGLGDGRFRREADVAASKVTVNAFASVGYSFSQRFAAIVDYTGQDVAVALSVAPFQCVPLVITPGFADITGSAGDGARFVVAIGLSTRFDRNAFFRRPCSR